MKAIWVAMAICGIASAQAVDGLHAPVSRTLVLPVDEADFVATVWAPLDATAQQVKQALQNAGAPNPTVVGVGIGPNPSPYTAAPLAMYSANFTVPAGSATELAKILLDLRSKLPAPLTTLQFGVAYHASAANVEAARQNMLPKLVEDSRKAAQGLAAASGVKLGSVRAIGEGGGVYGFLRAGSGMQIFGDFSIPAITSLPSTTQYTFYLELVFATIP